jgi:hypothetical protein
MSSYLPLWILRTREMIFQCYFCGSTSMTPYGNGPDVEHGSSLVCTEIPDTTIQSNVKQYHTYQQKQQRQNQYFPLWLLFENQNMCLFSLHGHNQNRRYNDNEDIEIQYGITPFNLQEAYELYRV